MAVINVGLAVLALLASASGAKSKSKVLRQTCVDKNGVAQAEGAIWYEGVSGCLKVTCTNGVAVGTDSCQCTYPDNTKGGSGDVWYSIPTCQSCKCDQGRLNCDKLLNCILPSTTSTAASTTTGFGTGYTCDGPDSIKMNPGDMYIDGCQNCTCTAAGLSCAGMVSCPLPSVTTQPAADQCFMGWLGFIDANVGDSYVPNGYVFVDGCNRCVCQQGMFACDYTCTNGGSGSGTGGGNTATVTVTPTETVEPTESVDAEEDCDVGTGIVLDQDAWVNGCGAECICRHGSMDCRECPTTSTPTPTVAPTSTSEYVCVDTNGKEVQNGNTTMVDKCTKCICVNGVFTCTKVCERDCKTSDGEVILHNKTKKKTCQSCKCKDATLTCTNTCAGQVCKVPNSKTTIKPGKSKTLDKCTWCKCTSTVLLQCRDKCPTNTNCVCKGRALKDGKTRTSKCEKCTCNNGNVTCKKTC